MVCGIHVVDWTPKLFLIRATMKVVRNTVEDVKFTYLMKAHSVPAAVWL
jgi:hypothetical protein